MRNFASLLLCTLSALWAGAQAAQVCHVSGSDVVCPGSAELMDITASLVSISATGVKDYDTLRIHDNELLERLPGGLLGDLRFSEIQINGCPNLSQAEDFLGASRETLVNLTMDSNALTSVPPLCAYNLLRVYMRQPWTTINLEREQFTDMPNVQYLQFEAASVGPYAFFNLKNLDELYIYGLKNVVLETGSFHFDSPALSYVFVVGSTVQETQLGTYDGFPSGSRLWIERTEQFTADLFYNLLSRGASIESPTPVRCDCNVAWIRLSSFLPQTNIRCQTSRVPVALAYKPEEDFKLCGTICSL